jgi:hypothetical protein
VLIVVYGSEGGRNEGTVVWNDFLVLFGAMVGVFGIRLDGGWRAYLLALEMMVIS